MRLSQKIAMFFALGAIPTFSLMAADAAAGQKVYTAKCRTCHGPAGQGNPAMAKVLKAEIRDLGSAEVQHKSDDELKKESRDGTGRMKPTAGLTGADLENVIAYIRTLKK